jgi:uncharacterized coiled-coil DUF342 family protein
VTFSDGGNDITVHGYPPKWTKREPIQDDIEYMRVEIIALTAERDRLQAQVESLQAQVESLREERELDVRVATWEVRFNALEAERDRLKEKADYWERQYVIESENADDFHAERNRLQSEVEELKRELADRK